MENAERSHNLAILKTPEKLMMQSINEKANEMIQQSDRQSEDEAVDTGILSSLAPSTCALVPRLQELVTGAPIQEEGDRLTIMMDLLNIGQRSIISTNNPFSPDIAARDCKTALVH